MSMFHSISFIYATSLLFFCTVSFALQTSLNSSQSLRDGTTLLSDSKTFELGFFSLGSSKTRYLGIWYYDVPVKTIVWVANRCNPINDSSGLLRINSIAGSLELLNRNKSVVWSINSTKQSKKPILELLDSGNLVLNDGENNLWQSFDHPSDTFLPGMKIGWDFKTGLKRSLSAWKNMEDPCPGDLSYGFELKNNSCPEIYILKGTRKYYRSGPWNGVRFSGVPEMLETNPVYNFSYVYNNDEVYFTFFIKIKNVTSRIILNQTTSTRQRLVWLNQKWNVYSISPEDDCDKYNHCGANGNCSMVNSNTVCQCLSGFKPKSQENWKAMNWSEGCLRNYSLNCENVKNHKFVKFGGLKLPETTNSWVNRNMSLGECQAKCLRNCSCMAYSNSNITGQGSRCILWFGNNLFDIRHLSTNGEDLYIRYPATEINKGSDGLVEKVVATVASVGIVFGMILAYCICKRKFCKDPFSFFKVSGKRYLDKEKTEETELPLFDLATIAHATNDFSNDNKLGQGGFGAVFKGTLADGQEIAVKRLSKSSGQGVNEFKNEVILIAKLQHRNLVKLLGCCIQGEEKLLIYEYMPNKSLDFFIFDETRRNLLDWPKRFEIICGIARGILYLHQDSRLRIIHRDLKLSNVLLDSDLIPKISDFGMAKTFGGNQTEGNTNRVVGTYGYMAPEYASDGLFSVKSDVFSFGILVLEIISGTKNRGFFHNDKTLNLSGHAWTLWKEGSPLELIDKSVVEKCTQSEVLRCIHIALLCVQQRPEDRPTMSTVAVMLGSRNALPAPKQPGFFMEISKLDQESSSKHNQESISANDFTITQLEAR
ncbi:G-type lectin S-receptor-like serine/threonine-protein kinase At4g27290 isoform X2 [Humulus lupulus]|uniref:G-type lectin S-receptor-like serine/threonine-protein kinase At4g27290 isoform X2 n=1 Tax=Humulus lupulus TaxID=3486 RepID=UPI002B4044F2|nr:G-type lectin S-receptor-like serine/threonine-protein kinase At4g27290 isoform X2 [Humulus lupulus]